MGCCKWPGGKGEKSVVAVEVVVVGGGGSPGDWAQENLMPCISAVILPHLLPVERWNVHQRFVFLSTICNSRLGRLRAI